MKNKLLFILTILLLTGQVFPQSNNFELINKSFTQSKSSDFLIQGNQIFAVTEKGDLFTFNSETGDSIYHEKQLFHLKPIIVKDRKGNIVVCDDQNRVYQLNTMTHNWKELFRVKMKYQITGIAFDEENQAYLITKKGILDVKKDSLYFPKKRNPLSPEPENWTEKPQYIADKKGDIWVGFGYGEWGGELFLFRTGKNSFVDSLSLFMNPINSIVEGNSEIYIGSGLMHMFTISGTISKIQNYPQQIKIFFSSYQSELKREGEYIGPIFFNEKENQLYFYSQNGIFKGKLSDDLIKIENWTNILKPNLTWQNGQAHAVGLQMNVLKLAVFDNENIVFLSQNEGIGIFNGTQLIMVK